MATPVRSGERTWVGSPAIDPQGRRTRRPGGRRQRLEVTLADDELAALRAKAGSAGVSIQRYLVDSALHADRPPVPDLRRTQGLLMSLRKEVHKVGTNLNQLAKVANSTGLVPTGLRDATDRLPEVEAKIAAALGEMAEELTS